MHMDINTVSLNGTSKKYIYMESSTDFEFEESMLIIETIIWLELVTKKNGSESVMISCWSKALKSVVIYYIPP